MDDCPFCLIAEHQLNSTILYEDETVIAFEDINPQLPIHSLVIPKRHYDHIGDSVPEELLGHLFAVTAEVARMKGVEEGGYRVITNVGEDGGQTVGHLHIHILGGARLPIRMGPAD